MSNNPQRRNGASNRPKNRNYRRNGNNKLQQLTDQMQKMQETISAKAAQNVNLGVGPDQDNTRYKIAGKNNNRTNVYDPTLAQVQFLMNKDGQVMNGMKQLASQIKQSNKNQQRVIQSIIEKKIGSSEIQNRMSEEQATQFYDRSKDPFGTYDTDQIVQLLAQAFDSPKMAAQVFSMVKPWLQKGTQYLTKKFVDHGIPYLKDKYHDWAKTGMGQQVGKSIQDWTGYNIHDWNYHVVPTIIKPNTYGNTMAFDQSAVAQGYSSVIDNVSIYQNNESAQLGVDGVSLESLAAMFDPDNNSSLVTIGDQAATLLSKRFQQPIVTNKDGDFYCTFQTNDICSNLYGSPNATTAGGFNIPDCRGAFITTSDPSLPVDVNKGTFSPLFQAGPYAKLLDTIGNFVIIGFAMEVVITSPILTQQGMATLAYAQKGFTTEPANGSFTNTSAALTPATALNNAVELNQLMASNHCVQNSTSTANKMCIRIAPLTEDDRFIEVSNGNNRGPTAMCTVFPYSSTNPEIRVADNTYMSFYSTKSAQRDQIIFAIQGASSGEIGVIYYTPLMMFIPTPAKLPVYNLTVPPQGNQTLNVAAAMIKARRHILILGPKEMQEFIGGLLSCKPTFNAVISFTLGFFQDQHITSSLSNSVGTGKHIGPSASIVSNTSSGPREIIMDPHFQSRDNFVISELQTQIERMNKTYQLELQKMSIKIQEEQEISRKLFNNQRKLKKDITNCKGNCIEMDKPRNASKSLERLQVTVTDDGCKPLKKVGIEEIKTTITEDIRLIQNDFNLDSDEDFSKIDNIDVSNQLQNNRQQDDPETKGEHKQASGHSGGFNGN